MERKILVVTHGGMAHGMKDTLDLFLENTENITYMNCFTDIKEPKQALDTFFKGLNSDDELIVFTDLMAGSVNQILMSYFLKHEFKLITGINLPLVLQIALCAEDSVSDEYIRDTIVVAREELKYVNDEIGKFKHANDHDEIFA